MINIKSELKKIGLGLSYILLLILLIRYFDMGKWSIIVTLWISSLIWALYGYFKHKTPIKIKTLITNAIYLTIFINIIFWLGQYAIYGYILSVALICSVILIKRRKRYFEIKHYIEKQIWGKPLYKYRENGKKPPKIEIIR